MSTSLSTTYQSSKSWSHSVELGVKVGVEVEVTSPGKALLGGASATYGFEASFGYSHGWGSGESISHEVSHAANINVPPRSKIKVKIVGRQTIEDVPYTAKYRIKYDDGSTRIVDDEGVMKQAFRASTNLVISASESLDSAGIIICPN